MITTYKPRKALDTGGAINRARSSGQPNNGLSAASAGFRVAPQSAEEMFDEFIDHQRGLPTNNGKIKMAA